jgi:quercetin dioxygenase-like cupin family protein
LTPVKSNLAGNRYVVHMHNNKKPTENAAAKVKGLPGAQVTSTLEIADYQDDAVVSRELVRKPTGNVTFFAFDEGQGLSEHTAPFDALAHIVEGEVEITISGKTHRLQRDELILMPAGQPHALKALKRFKMILTMIRS